MAEEPFTKPAISDQVGTLVDSKSLKNQVDGLAYGQVTFEIRDGRVYRVNVTSSHIFNEQEVLGNIRRRTLYTTQGKP